MKQEIIRGCAYLFGDNINTDFINPAQYMELPMDQMIQHAMEGADPDFSKNVRPGDVMVAKEIAHGDELEVDPIAGTIRDLTTGKDYTCTALPPHILELVNDGGLIPHLEKTLKKKD